MIPCLATQFWIRPEPVRIPFDCVPTEEFAIKVKLPEGRHDLVAAVDFFAGERGGTDCDAYEGDGGVETEYFMPY